MIGGRNKSWVETIIESSETTLQASVDTLRGVARSMSYDKELRGHFLLIQELNERAAALEKLRSELKSILSEDTVKD